MASGIGFGRQETLNALKEKEDLDTVNKLQGIEDLKEKILEASVHKENSTVISPDQQTIDKVDTAADILEKKDAVDPFLKDSTLLKNLNRFRKAFNKWKARSIREKKIPSPVEAGRANYPTKKAKKASRSKRKASEELEEAEKTLRGSIKGARNRALKEVGSSITEVREKKKKSKREILKEELTPGDIVDIDPGGGERKARVRRINKKSITFDEWRPGRMGGDPGVGKYRKKLDTLAIGLVKDDNGKRLARKNGDKAGLIERADPIEDRDSIETKEELFAVNKKDTEFLDKKKEQTTFGSPKKEFKDKRQNISISSSEKVDNKKPEFTKKAESLDTFTENKNLTNF